MRRRPTHEHVWAPTAHDDYWLPSWDNGDGKWQKMSVGKDYACSVCGVPQPPPPPPSLLKRLGWRVARLRVRLASWIAGYDIEARE